MPKTLLTPFGLTAVILGAALASAQLNDPSPQVPEPIRAPAGEAVALSARASGSQIYTCQASADGKFSWTLKAPDAELRDQNDHVIGRHFAGPTWKLNDGSAVTGKATAHADSPDPDSVPWLLVTVTSHSGNGLLDNVTAIQRIHTHGGKPPAQGCDADHRDTETKSSYTADYYFYAPAPTR
jgi:hypothetical protein